jgi:outer membrane protein OmpA-like peptidoglycan-associated protein
VKIPFLLIFLFCIEAPAATHAELRAELQKSKETWQAWRKQNGNSYVYRSVNSSVFGSFGLSAVFIQDGTFRLIKSCQYYDENSPVTRSTRIAADFADARPPRTIDEGYEFCEKEVLPKLDQNTDSPRILFSKNGLLKECTYHPALCMDDCRRGIRIASVKPLRGLKDTDVEICPDSLSIYFERASSALSTDARKELKRAAVSFRSSNLHLLIEGHADHLGSVEKNLELGEKRALAVKAYLVKLGVLAESLSIVSYGKEKSIALGEDKKSHVKNRRVRIRPQLEPL